ncbi:hypothetical protein ZWY2020_027326 [Hordeum vulgare]|nr:hypothetical protein ZWY2020_029499 [Hordeum vulgare]KAI5002676.1 hypothetical protein ZWY2020_027326 [Hordeum vulgare]
MVSTSGTVAIVVAILTVLLSPASCRRVLVAGNNGSGGEIEAPDQCVQGCLGEMLACQQASAGCATVKVAMSSRRQTTSQRQRSVPCGYGGCEDEYLGCIDVC